MKKTFDESLQEFNKLIDEIESDHQETIVKEAKELAQNVVSEGEPDAQYYWDRLWDKPLYANVHVETAKKWRGYCEPYFAVDGIWRDMKRDSGDFHIARNRSKFMALGQKIIKIRERNVPLERLYAMVGAAEALTKWEEDRKFPLKSAPELNVELLRSTQKMLGYRWGPVTLLHFLTDLGLACKPDIHLNTTCQYLGMTIQNTSNPIEEALAIVEFVKHLVAGRWGSVTPYYLRYTDKCLMEASVKKMFSPEV